MKKLHALAVGFIFLSLSTIVYSDDIDNENNQKRKIVLTNQPISIFTPQTQQLNGNENRPSLLSFAMLRRTASLETGLFSGHNATFDKAILYRVTSNPAGSPFSGALTESVTMQVSGYYLINFSYAGDQITADPLATDFYAMFNLVINGSIVESFVLSTFRIMQSWQYIVFLSKGDELSIQAASDVSFFEGLSPSIPATDSLIMTINWVGPYIEPS